MQASYKIVTNMKYPSYKVITNKQVSDWLVAGDVTDFAKYVLVT